MDYLLETRDLTKSFPGVNALKQVGFACRPGVVHGLVGENGAGKSTLIKVVSGAYQADSGEIFFKGQKVEFRTPHDAIQHGIRVVYQEFTLVPYLTVAENISLGSIPMKGVAIDRKEMNRRALDYMEKLGLSLDPGLMVSDLSIAEQQFVEIVKAISQEASLLILDEPTAALNSHQVDRLMALIEDIRKTGIGIVFVSHRLSEVLKICDTITIMKDGEIVDTCPCCDLDQDRLVSRMVGRELRYTFPARVQERSDEVLMKVDGLASRAMKHPVSLNLQRKEVLGVYGLEGQGQREFLRTLAGLETPTAGTVCVADQPVAIKTPRQAVRSGIAYTPADRKGEGLATDLSVRMNIGMPSLVRGRGSLIHSRDILARCKAQIADLHIKVASLETSVVNLSGGNQQKIVIGKWMSVGPQVLVLDEPTRGIDVESKMEVYSILRQLADAGVGVLVLSSDLIELIGLCDRMVIFFEGRVTGSLSHEEFTEERVMACATATNGQGERAI